MLKRINLRSLILLVILVLLTGCSGINKLTVKNEDFEYMKNGKITKVNINNTRDKGFRFVVTDEKAITDIYNILSTAKSVTTKSSLQPDYIFELYTADNVVHKFSYIAGIDEKNAGNFYSDNKTYIVSNIIDTDIISSFWNARKPKVFNDVYYNSILKALGDYRESVNKTDPIGINIKDDVEVSKFILSVDLEDFIDSIDKNDYNSKVISDSNVNTGVVMNIETKGYKTDVVKNEGLYKCTITFINKKDNSEKIYYVYDNYKDNNWSISVVADNKPVGF